MINFYTNRELSRKLEVNLAKWKRWSREFLPPDPLGGLQSGYARQYNPKEAFTVYLGGCLVADLKFSIPEAKQILSDLGDWIEQNLLEFNKKNNNADQNGTDVSVQHHTVFISRITDSQNKTQRLLYRIRGTFSDEPFNPLDRSVRHEVYTEISKPDSDEISGLIDMNTFRVLGITRIYDRFVSQLNQISRKK